MEPDLRRDDTADGVTRRPCVCDAPGCPSRPCHFCRRFAEDDRYRRLWSGEPQLPGPPAATASTGDCLELGAALSGQEAVPCGLRLRRCAVHELCTTRIAVPGVACCATCEQHTGRERAGV